MKDKLHLAYGTDEEHLSSEGHYSTHEDAALDCILEQDCEVGDTVHVSEIKTFTPKVDATELIWNRLNEIAQEECGETADDWPNCTKESLEQFEKQVQVCIHELLTKNKERDRLYKCFNSKSFEVTQEMIDKASND